MNKCTNINPCATQTINSYLLSKQLKCSECHSFKQQQKQ